MSILIDQLISSNNRKEISGKWYVAKPKIKIDITTLSNNMIDAWQVILGKSIAVHFKEDEKDKNEKD